MIILAKYGYSLHRLLAVDVDCNSTKEITMSTRPTQSDREMIKVDPNKVNKDDLMAFIYYVKVEKADMAREELLVQDLLSGSGTIRVNGKELIKNSLSADFFDKEESVTMTRLAEILCDSPNRPLTVCFIKKDGSQRKLRGRWLGQEKMMGRSFCEDLDIQKTAKDDGVREVDHRSIQYLIVDGVKYNLKSKK